MTGREIDDAIKKLQLEFINPDGDILWDEIFFHIEKEKEKINDIKLRQMEDKVLPIDLLACSALSGLIASGHSRQDAVESAYVIAEDMLYQRKRHLE